MELRKLPEQSERVETGPTQFGEDWPGVFIRGDNALWYAHLLEQLMEFAELDESAEFFLAASITGFLRTLRSCDAKQHDSREDG